MDGRQDRDNQSGYDQDTFGRVGAGTAQSGTYGQESRRDSYNYSQKYNGTQGALGQPLRGESRAQYGQKPPDGGAFYHSGEPPQGMGFGIDSLFMPAIASMVLGILALVLFCFCINIPVAIMAVIFGIIHICRHTGNNGFAIAGIVTSVVSVILTILLTIVLYFMGVNSASTWIYDGYYPFGNYFYEDPGDYDFDGYDDYFDGDDDFEGIDF